MRPQIAVIFQVLYDTPQGTIRLTVQDYTPLPQRRVCSVKLATAR
jgi:hypothetical protein